MIAIRYRWRYWDEIRNRYTTTSYHCTAEQIHVEHPDAVPVEGTRQELEVLEPEEALCVTSAAHINTGGR